MKGARPISKEEHKIVKLQFHTLRNRCLYILAKNTGFRISELLSLKVSDVYKKDYVKVTRRNMKGKYESREVILNSEAKESIESYLFTRDLKSDGPLFISREGDNLPISRFQAHRIYKEAFKKAGLTGSLSTHSARKTFALNFYEKSGNDLILTSKAIGHKNIVTTVRYLPVNLDKLNKLILED